MPIENPKYDVALSFLSKDEPTAAAIHLKLSEGLSVFFFPRSQEDLAGTDGLESMRKPFFDDSRVMVILYREPWGQTPWTRVEETAIKDACLQHGWKRLFFIVLDRASPLPVWLPQTHVRFNFEDFGLEQAVGAIKARVRENGGQFLPLTATKRAEMLKAQQQFQRDKRRMNSEEGIAAILGCVADLFQEIESRCTEINSQHSFQIKCETHSSKQSCIVTNGQVSLGIWWRQKYVNLLDDSHLLIRGFQGRLLLFSEGHLFQFEQPSQVSEKKYFPDLSRAREHVWTRRDDSEFLSSSALAEKCVIQFLDLVARG
jgi:hypothetical protein